MLQTRLKTIVFVFFTTLCFSQSAMAFQAWWQCSSRMGGDWSFGRAPSVCLVDHMQTQSEVKSQYSPLLFADSKSRSSERRRYITELNALAKEIAEYYLKKRKPGVSQAEIEAFKTGLLTLMHQETVWSHYRQASDGRVRYMRGDNGHGHGLMQVDDRSHQSALLQGRGADLIKNMVYGLDVFYAAWERAPKQSCVNGPSDYTRRIRSAWSAYNGGPARICRWTSTTGTFAHHDKDFYTKLKNKSWTNYIDSESKKTPLNIKCLAEGTRPCANNGSDPTPVVPQNGELYIVDSGLYCVYGPNELRCFDRLNDVNCLAIENNRNYPIAGVLEPEKVKNHDIVRVDRNALCLSAVDGLSEITQEIELQKNINLRKTPGGELISTVPAATRAKVVDFEVTSSSDQKRYYKVNHNGNSGFVYAGNSSSYQEWTKEVSDQSDSVLANIGDSIKIVARNGINQRQTPGGKYIQRIPNSQILEVLDRVVRGSQNYLYYQVNYNGRTGYIYSGYLTRITSVSDWTQKVSDDPQVDDVYQLSSGYIYRFLKQCPEATCGFTSHVLIASLTNDRVIILEERNGWTKVRTLDSSKIGWIRKQELDLVGE